LKNRKIHHIFVWALCVLFTDLFANQSVTCPTYTKMSCLESEQNTLPLGWCVFSILNKTGLFISSIHQYDPYIIPSTENDIPRSISISQNGLWVCYIDKNSHVPYLVRTDGTVKVRIPVHNVSPEFSQTAGFYRNSPYGTEIFYMANKYTLRAVRFAWSGNSVVFGTTRTIASIGQDAWFNTQFSAQVRVSGDRIFCREERRNSITYEYIGRSAFITIPDGGRGTAQFDDIYRWKDDAEEGVWGCGHAMSWNGAHCLANSALIGNTCVPNRKSDPMMDHKGFYVTPFRKSGSPLIDINDHIDRFGTSINWCPPVYRFGEYTDVDFTGWQFSNNSSYIIGKLAGEKTPVKGLWVVNWTTNDWTLITPQQKTLEFICAALYFGPMVDTRTFLPSGSGGGTVPGSGGPGYRVVSPNGGEHFVVGDTIDVMISSKSDGLVDILLYFGAHSARIPGFSGSVNPREQNLVRFVVPGTLPIRVWDAQSSISKTIHVSLVSDSCKIKIMDYLEGSEYFDFSDRYFSIGNSSPVLGTHASTRYDAATRPHLIISPSLSYEKMRRFGVGRGALFLINGKRVGTPSSFNHPRSSGAIIVRP